MQEIKLDDVPTVQLKAMVYDMISAIEQSQKDVKLLNQIILERNDKENKKRISSEKPDGEKPIETKPNEETSE